MEQKDSKKKEILELKYKKMMERITRLEGIVNLIYPSNKNKNQAIQIIKTYYQEMYNKILETGQYDKYEQVEDTILEGMAKIEIDQHIQDTYKSIGTIVQNKLTQITDLGKYDRSGIFTRGRELEQLDKYISNNTTNLEKLLEQINQIKEMLKLYEEYIKPEEKQQIQEQISIAKFKILIRMQIGRVLVGEIRPQSTLCEYDSEEERNIFEQQLAELIKQTPNIQLEQPVSQIMQDSKKLNKILAGQIIGIAEKDVNLLHAPIFNAHLCNIEAAERKKGTDVNISALSAVIDKFITRKDISILLCQRVYERFGFNCRPIILSEEQKVVANLWNLLKQTRKYKEWSRNPVMWYLPENALIIRPLIDIIKGKKAEILIKPRICDFSTEDIDEQCTYPYPKRSDLSNITDDELIKRLIETETEGKIPETEAEEEKGVEELKRKQKSLYQEFYRSYAQEKRIRELERKLEIINQLRKIKGKKLEVDEIIKRLEVRYEALKLIGEPPNKWRILPLSSVLQKLKTPYVPVKAYNKTVMFYDSYIPNPMIRYYTKELWEDYIKESFIKIEKAPYASNFFDRNDENSWKRKPFSANNDIKERFPSGYGLFAYIKLDEMGNLPLDLDKITYIEHEEEAR